ncbi:MAG: hypothetical protein HY881_01845 [Deltaproteobacteria bacterium]|nr:hypothetical protein [Deltaproteobacteria bacterium]
MIEKNFDIPFTAGLALREKQIQQNYRPIIAVHKWFARRPGTLFRGLLLSEFLEKTLHESFYQANSLKGIKVADPFMGGGTPLIEANRLGCEIAGFDINPMAYWIVKQEIEHLDLDAYLLVANSLREQLEKEIHCPACKDRHTGRFFKIPDSQDLVKADEAEERWVKRPQAMSLTMKSPREMRPIGSIARDTGTTGKCSMLGNFSAWSYPHCGSPG